MKDFKKKSRLFEETGFIFFIIQVLCKKPGKSYQKIFLFNDNDDDGDDKHQLQNLLRQVAAYAYGHTILLCDDYIHDNNGSRSNPSNKKAIQKEKV